jgi:UDP-glucose 4-epimerase
MKAIVFGGSGFLGSHVADELSGRGYKVVVYDRQTSPYLRKDQKMVVGDILDREKVAAYVKGCNYVYSFAGIAGIADARRYPVQAVETNVLGTTNIIDACRLNNVQRFIFASTIYVYSDLAPFYRSSKQACELIIEDYQKAYGLNYTILRYGSLYGRRANHFNYIYKIVQQAVEEGKIVRKGDGEEIRSYIHVRDAAKSSVDILSEEFRNQYVMLTGSQSIKIKELLNMIREIFHGEISVEYSGESDAGHYEITPYSFRPRVAKKIVAGSYYDLGQGILDVIHEVYSKSGKNGEYVSNIRRLVEPEQG